MNIFPFTVVIRNVKCDCIPQGKIHVVCAFLCVMLILKQVPQQVHTGRVIFDPYLLHCVLATLEKQLNDRIVIHGDITSLPQGRRKPGLFAALCLYNTFFVFRLQTV